MFRRILAACQGEAAARVIRTCRALGVSPVAIATPDDPDPGYLEEADDVARLVTADASSVLEAARRMRCAAIHPGWGELAKDPFFALRCEVQGIAFIGPSSSLAYAVGDPVRLATRWELPLSGEPPPCGTVRHLAFEVAADRDGRAACLGVRDASLRWRSWRLIEEAPPLCLPEDLSQTVGQRFASALAQVGLVGIATIEVEVQRDGRILLVGVHPGLEAGHATTEAATGQDLVSLQIQLAVGRALATPPPADPVYAVAVHVLAADPARSLAPSTGSLRYLRLPVGQGIRVDTHLRRMDPLCGGGDRVGSLDPLLCKVIVTGADRGRALDRAAHALRGTRIQGITTNLPFLLPILDHPAFRAGPVDDGFLAQRLADLAVPTPEARDEVDYGIDWAAA